MCKYKDICPAYDKWSEKCNYNLYKGSDECIHLLLEAYHQEKGTSYEDIKKYLK